MKSDNSKFIKENVAEFKVHNMPIYKRSNSFRTNTKDSHRQEDTSRDILSSINHNSLRGRKKDGMGLSLKFALPIILVFIGVIGLFTYFIARTSSEAIANEILKSGLAEVTLLSDVGSMIIEKSDRTFYLYGPKGNYEPWPVDLALITKHDFLKLAGYFEDFSLPDDISGDFRKRQETLFVARTGGLLKRVISYKSIDGVLHDSQTLAAYILVSKKEVIDFYTHDLKSGYTQENPGLLLLARSERGYEIDKGSEGILPIQKSNWIEKYADISECTIGDRKIVFGTREVPCVVYGGMVQFTGVMHKRVNGLGKEMKSLVFDTPIFDSDNHEIGRAIIAVRASQIVERFQNIYIVFGMSALFAIALSIITSFIVGMRVTKPIKLLINDMNAVANGDLSHKTEAHSSDEIGVVANEFNRITKILKVAYENEKNALKIESELDMAGEIQFNLLPTKLLDISDIDIFAAYQPAKEVGGDYYDLFQIDEKHYGLIVADVSGKGVPGSMVMATTRTILRFVAQNNLSTVDTMIKTNSMVAADIKRGMFVTVFYIVLDVENKSIECSSAGHNPMVIHRCNGEIELVNPGGIAMGFDKGPVFSKTIKCDEVNLNKGDRVILYTDGIVEAMNHNNEEYSDQKFYDFIKENSDLNSHNFVRKLLEDVEEHQGSNVQHDDITLLTFRVL